MSYPTPHWEKLNATLRNEKLPAVDFERVTAAIKRYERWIEDLGAVDGSPNEIVEKRVGILNEYSNYVNLELIFDSPADFLYRQKDN